MMKCGGKKGAGTGSKVNDAWPPWVAPAIALLPLQSLENHRRRELGLARRLLCPSAVLQGSCQLGSVTCEDSGQRTR